MKAIICKKYGPPELLKIEDVAMPIPKNKEILVRVQAASVNPLDWHCMRGSPLPVRLKMGWLKPKSRFMGADIAGIVEKVGDNVSQFQSGDKVFGDLFPYGYAGFAEYVCVPEKALAHVPENANFEEAAAIPIAAITALQAVRDYARIQKKNQVLVNGASGGVGTFVIQIAKAFGMKVTGVCSTRNADLVSSLGADRVIDYTKVDFTRGTQQYDAIIDNVGNHRLSALRKVLSPTGTVVVVGYSPSLMIELMLKGWWIAKTSKQRATTMMATTSQGDLNYLTGLYESGKMKSVIDRSYSLEAIGEAIAYLEEGHARGKVVINGF